MVKREAAQVFLKNNWPWVIATFSSGIIVGLLVRLPLLPEPNVFTTTLWAAIAGSSIAAALTIVGTLHVAMKLKERDGEAAAQAIVDATDRLLRHTQVFCEEVLWDFPKKEDGSYEPTANFSLDPSRWRMIRAATASMGYELEAVLKDLDVYKGSTVGLNSLRRHATRSINRIVCDLVEPMKDLRIFAEAVMTQTGSVELSGTPIELVRRHRSYLIDDRKTLMGPATVGNQ